VADKFKVETHLDEAGGGGEASSSSSSSSSSNSGLGAGPDGSAEALPRVQLRVAVVGGGPAGLYAAIGLALQVRRFALSKGARAFCRRGCLCALSFYRFLHLCVVGLFYSIRGVLKGHAVDVFERSPHPRGTPNRGSRSYPVRR
jgi:hypothetical protein